MSSIQLFDLNGEQRFTGTSVGGPQLAVFRVITSAQLLALPGAAVTLVPAGGTGVIVVPWNVVAWTTPGSAAYADGAALSLIVGPAANGWTVPVLSASQVQLATSTASVVPLIDALGGAVAGNLNFATSDWTDAALTVNLDPNGAQTPYTAGNGTVTFWVEYTLLSA
jgi:hypothetical protein